MIKLTNITKKFHNNGTEKWGLQNVSLDMQRGEIVCILGASGSGKSTLLRSIAGLETFDSGSCGASGATLGYVSQEYTLWPHLNVVENIILAPLLKQTGTRSEQVDKAYLLLERFELLDCAESYPHQLSGGQKQRVALLRSIMRQPDVLLLDEITSALDPELTKSVLDLIRALAKDGYTMIIVTHHMSFALSVASRILFMKQGVLVRDQSPDVFFSDFSDPEIRAYIMDIARHDESIEIFRGTEQYQAYHMGLIKRLPKNSTILIAGAVGDRWYTPMAEFYQKYEQVRIQKNIVWKMVTYDQGDTDRRLLQEHPELNQFRKMSRQIQNPANYNVFGDTVITQIFEQEPTIIQIKNQSVADAYTSFFEDLWEQSSE